MRILCLALSALFGIPAIAHADPLPSPAAAVKPESVAKNDADDGFFGWVWRGLADEAHLRVGYGVVQWAMDVKRASDGATARLVQRDNTAAFIASSCKAPLSEHSNLA